MAAIEVLEQDAKLKYELSSKCRYIDEQLRKLLSDFFSVSGHEESPIKHLFLVVSLPRNEEETILKSIVKYVSSSFVSPFVSFPHLSIPQYKKLLNKVRIEVL